MPSKMLRRSAISVIEYCNLIGYRPFSLVMIGIGNHDEEAKQFKEDWPTLIIHGYEPNPRCYEMVKDTFPGSAVPKALSNYNGTGTLYWKNSWKTGSSLWRRPEDRTSMEVTVGRLDDEGFPQIEERGVLLWLDCEGSELNVLKGAEKFLQMTGVVNVEFTGRRDLRGGENWGSPLEIYKLLTDAGFVQCWTHTNRIVVGQCDAIFVYKDFVKEEYCACPGSILDQGGHGGGNG